MTALAPELPGAPDYAEAFAAWRVWRVLACRDGYRLASVVKSTVWPPGEPLAAECLRSPLGTFFRRRRAKMHAAPDAGCECGIYAGRLARVGDYLTEPPAAAVTRVLGEVSLWGTVIECERGFRASLAYPARLYVPVDPAFAAEERWEALVAALEAYGVPVEVLPARASEAVRVVRESRV